MQNFKEGIAFLFWLFLSVNGTALKLDTTLLADDDNVTVSRNLRSQSFENKFGDGRKFDDDDELTIVSIGYYCKNGQPQTIALGLCSPFYIQCSNSEVYSIEQCPLEQIYDGQRCVAASTIRECLDPRLNGLNLATENLASATGACNNGPGIQLAGMKLHPAAYCSRQALLCDSFREPHAISCTLDQTLDSETLKCVPSTCRWEPKPKVKDSLLRGYCNYKPPTAKCQNWFVWCHDGLFGFCEGQQIYDETISGCRPPHPEERCQPLNVCPGFEWKAVELGQCMPQFRYCEGLKPITFTCREGFVFQDNACIPYQSAKGCPECKKGETKPAKHCKQFFECEKYGLARWSLKTCPTNEFYNRENRRCELNYGNSCADFQQTCKDGDSYNPKCGDYLLCRNGAFFPGFCPHLTRWSKRQLQCIPDNTCRRYENKNECRHGDIIPTVDCETYFSCDPIKGQFVKRSCKENLYGKNPACEQCKDDKPIKPIWNPPTPPYTPPPYSTVKCINGEKIVDKIDCSRYIACISGEWYSLQCEDRTVFDSISGLCIHQSKSRCPRNGSHLDSFHHPPSTPGFGFGGNDDNGFPPEPPPFIPKPFKPPPPPPMDETRREMYEQSNGFLICSQKSPRFVADPRDCGSYLECENGFYQPRTCPPGHNFDAFIGRCSSTFTCDKICNDNERIPRKECGKVFECHNNAWFQMKCKDNTMFINGRCSEIPCPEDGKPSSTCYEGAVYSNERDCTRYVICRNGQLFEKQCSNGQKFNAETLTCSYKYDCSSESSPKCYGGERRAIPDSCSHYEECQYGSFVKVSCPYGKNFNSITKKCQPGPCQGSGSQIGEACTESPGLDGFLPDSLDCRRFYQCASGRWVPKTCGPGTAFSPQLGVCDHIRNVVSCARS